MTLSRFALAFEQLVVTLRDQPRDDAAARAAAAAAAELTARFEAPARFEAGVEGSAISSRTTLRGRMLARAVDWIEVERGVSGDGLLALATALASDEQPIPQSPGIRVELVPLPVVPSATEADDRWRERAQVPLLAPDDDGEADPELDGVTAAAEEAVGARAWAQVVERAGALLACAERDPERRRVRLIVARRVLPRPVLEELLEHALRRPEDQQRVADVLARIGPEGHEVMVQGMASTESLAARRFLHDRLAATPDALPLLLPLVSRGAPHQVRHAAGVLARLGDPSAIQALADAFPHADEPTRGELLRALAQFPDAAARQVLVSGLSHEAPATRIAAAAAIGGAQILALSPALMTAFRAEPDSSVRRALATAAARIGSVEALEELVRVALARRTLLKGGEPVEVRLDAVAGLAVANSGPARRCLDRIVREGEGQVQEAADQALSVRRG